MEGVLEKSHADIDEWQTQMQLQSQSLGEVYLYSDGLSESDRELTGVHVVDSINDAVSESLARHQGPIAVIPEGPYVVPFTK